MCPPHLLPRLDEKQGPCSIPSAPLPHPATTLRTQQGWRRSSRVRRSRSAQGSQSHRECGPKQEDIFPMGLAPGFPCGSSLTTPVPSAPLPLHKCHPGGQTLPPPTALSNVTSNTHQIHLSRYPLQNKPRPSPEVCPIAPRPHSPVAGRRKESKGDSLGGGSDTGAEALPGLCLGMHCHRPFTGRPIMGSSGVYLTAKDPRTHWRGNLHQAPSTPLHTSRAYC